MHKDKKFNVLKYFDLLRLFVAIGIALLITTGIVLLVSESIIYFTCGTNKFKKIFI